MQVLCMVRAGGFVFVIHEWIYKAQVRASMSAGICMCVYVWKCFGEFIIAGATVKARNILNNNIEIVIKVRALASFALKFVR